MRLKRDLVRQHASPPQYLSCDLRTFDFTSLGIEFDAIVVNAPWEEYARRWPNHAIDAWSFAELQRLPIKELGSRASFVFLWCGSAEGLQYGRVR